jgi:hypothetical protein
MDLKKVEQMALKVVVLMAVEKDYRKAGTMVVKSVVSVYWTVGYLVVWKVA